MLLKRFWFEFDLSGEELRRFGHFPAFGVGITAYDYEDALTLMRKWVLREGDDLPRMTKVIENVDVSRLLERAFGSTRLLPHLGCPAWRGVWHPAFNIWYGPDLQRSPG
jgi:hypothetical protein